MKAVAVRPRKADSIELREVARPDPGAIPDGRGVLVEVLRVGVDGTDKEISEGLYGDAPGGDDFLIIGHENIGRVVEAGDGVPADLRPGALVVATVRRPGSSVYDRIGLQDMTTDEVYFERGISHLHGYLAEFYAEDATYLVPMPPALTDVGVLLEPMSVAEKGIRQAFEIQRRLRIWRPLRAAVLGAGTIGLLATLQLRLRGLDVVCYSRRPAPYRNSELVERLGATYVSSNGTTVARVAERHGPFDIILDATGFSPLAFEAAVALGKNGVLVLASVTGGDRRIEVPTDRINQGFVLGNKVMVGTVNAAREDYVAGVGDMLRAEAFFPAWLGALLTTRIDGLEGYREMLDRLTNDRDAIKVYVQVSE